MLLSFIFLYAHCGHIYIAALVKEVVSGQKMHCKKSNALHISPRLTSLHERQLSVGGGAVGGEMGLKIIMALLFISH